MSAQAESSVKKAKRVRRSSEQTQANETHKKIRTAGDAQPRLEALDPIIWERIVRDLCPSQLSILSQVCTRMRGVIVQLPVWQQISTTASLGALKARGRQSTYFGLVLYNSHRICEVCHKICKRTIAYEAALPVAIVIHKKFVRMCLQCRQEYFLAHPEPPRREVSPLELTRCGGYVGFEAQKERVQAAREKRDERHQPERAERRSYLRAAFAAAGLAHMNEDDQEVGAFIRRGVARNAWQSTAERIISNIHERNASLTRHNALKTAMSERGLELQENSNIIRQYIDHGRGDIHAIVTSAVEMNWLYRETNFQQLQHVTEEFDEWDGYASRRVTRHRIDCEVGKERALHEYARRRLLALGQWEDISVEKNTSARPPISLWNRIRAISQMVWLEEASSTFVGAGIRAYQAHLFSIDPTEPSVMTNELFTQMLDMGAISSIATKARDPPPPIPFSMSLRNTIGDEHFGRFIEASRRHLVNVIRGLYVASVLENLPAGVYEFAARCKQDLDMTILMYEALEREFIRSEVPSIARQQNVHPQYIIHLLKVLRHHGHMGTRAQL